MKLKLYSVLILIFISIALISGLKGAGAWFSDSKKLPNNIIRSGSLDLQLSGGPLNANDLEPGANYTQMGSFCNNNSGTIDLKYRGLFESDMPASTDLIKFLTIKVEMKTNGDWATLQEIQGNPAIETDGLRYYFKFSDQDPAIINKYLVSGNLIPGEEICYRLSAKLNASTPNYDQHKTIDFVLHLQVTQITNPGW